MLKKFRFPLWTFPVALAALITLAYGILSARQGFYWDDWPFTWIARNLGDEGFVRYFSTNRPVRAFFYIWLYPVLGYEPLPWQLFSLALRALSGLALWALLRRVWPQHARPAAAVTLLFLIYPGFSQQPLAVTYSSFFFVQTLLFTSITLTLAALANPRRARLYHGAALTLSAVNLFTMEYFVGLELLRAVFIYVTLQGPGRLRAALRAWWPYAALLGVYLFWRIFIFGFILYKPELMSETAAAPAQTLLTLPLTIAQDVSTAALGVWLMSFRLPDVDAFGRASTLVYAILTLGGSALATLYLSRLATGHSQPEPSLGRARANGWMWLGLFAMLVSGGVFWVARLDIRPEFPNDRFLLPFALGSAFFIVGLAERFARPAWLRVAVIGLLVGFGIGQQFQYGNFYRREWERQQSFFWQMAWRAPELKPGTLLVSYESPFKTYTDNSLTAPFNWVYAPENTTQHMDVMYYFLTVRLDMGRPLLQPDQPIVQNYLAAGFSGNTSNMLVIDFNPPACLRVYDPAADLGIPMLPGDLRNVQPLSNLNQIITDPPAPARPLPESIFGREPLHGWCYHYQKADLARQRGDWEEVARLGDLAFALNDRPNEASERVVFIEGYAHTGRWDEALALTREARAITPAMQPMLCAAWQRIATQGGDPAVAAGIQAELACQP